MILVTDEIAKALESLSLFERDFRRLPDPEAKTLYVELLDTFVDGGDRRWWWEALKQEQTSIQFDDNKGFERIPLLVPDSRESVWFIAEEAQMPFYPIYEATPETITKVLGECYAFEYYIVPKSKEWLLCENHHGYVIGVGNAVKERLVRIAA